MGWVRADGKLGGEPGGEPTPVGPVQPPVFVCRCVNGGVYRFKWLKTKTENAVDSQLPGTRGLGAAGQTLRDPGLKPSAKTRSAAHLLAVVTCDNDMKCHFQGL